jgi:hypothetical protein
MADDSSTSPAAPNISILSSPSGMAAFMMLLSGMFGQGPPSAQAGAPAGQKPSDIFGGTKVNLKGGGTTTAYQVPFGPGGPGAAAPNPDYVYDPTSGQFMALRNGDVISSVKQPQYTYTPSIERGIYTPGSGGAGAGTQGMVQQINPYWQFQQAFDFYKPMLEKWYKQFGQQPGADAAQKALQDIQSGQKPSKAPATAAATPALTALNAQQANLIANPPAPPQVVAPGTTASTATTQPAVAPVAAQSVAATPAPTPLAPPAQNPLLAQAAVDQAIRESLARNAFASSAAGVPTGYRPPPPPPTAPQAPSAVPTPAATPSTGLRMPAWTFPGWTDSGMRQAIATAAPTSTGATPVTPIATSGLSPGMTGYVTSGAPTVGDYMAGTATAPPAQSLGTLPSSGLSQGQKMGIASAISGIGSGLAQMFAPVTPQMPQMPSNPLLGIPYSPSWRIGGASTGATAPSINYGYPFMV